jgi:hypothetical protein
VLAVLAVATAVVGMSGVAAAIPPGPQTIIVSDEAELLEALATLAGITAEEGAEHTIVLDADITLTQTGQGPTYAGQTALRIQGDGHTIDAAGRSRILTSGPAVVLDGLVVTGGAINNVGGAVFGYGDITLRNSRVEGNHASQQGGGVATFAALVVEDSVITGNTVMPPSWTTIAEGGGAYAAEGITVTRSTISGNTADTGGGFATPAEVHLTASTVSGNTADGATGVAGGFVGGQVTMDESTVTDNTAEEVGGVVARVSMAATLSTIAGNTTTTGPANYQGDADATWSAFGTVLADPIGGDNCLIAGSAQSAFSYADDDSCVLQARSDVQSGADPQLGDLADNGGPTETLLPGPASPLLDRIPAGVCATYPTDQRGEPRPEVADTGCDVGSVEGAGVAATCFGEPVTVVLAEGDEPTEEDDVILGTPGDDVVDALGGADRVCGLGGADVLRGGAGVDQLSGGGGPDDLGGGAGADVLNGKRGYDHLAGATGADRLVGGYGNDDLSGGQADDALVGGFDVDRCDGGSGTDSRWTCEALIGFP